MTKEFYYRLKFAKFTIEERNIEYKDGGGLINAIGVFSNFAHINIHKNYLLKFYTDNTGKYR